MWQLWEQAAAGGQDKGQGFAWGGPQNIEAFEMGRGWETLGLPVGPRGRHSQGPQKASISPGDRCFPPWDLWFLLNKGLSRMVHL